MKYNDKHPTVVARHRSFTQAMKVPPETAEFYEEMEPESGIVYSGHYYPCSTPMGGCGKNTGWTDITWGVAVHCCSEECRKAMDDRCEQVLRETGENVKTAEVEGVGDHQSYFKAGSPPPEEAPASRPEVLDDEVPVAAALEPVVDPVPVSAPDPDEPSR